ALEAVPDRGETVTMHRDVERIVARLGLDPHPEGGFFRETFRSPRTLTQGELERSASTVIYFLLPAGTFSAFHRIRAADEAWHHSSGDPVEIHTIAADGAHRVALLGGDLDHGERPQVLVPADTLQAAITHGERFALCGCSVTPGFDFDDFVMPSRDELTALFPQHRAVIERLTRP